MTGSMEAHRAICARLMQVHGLQLNLFPPVMPILPMTIGWYRPYWNPVWALSFSHTGSATTPVYQTPPEIASPCSSPTRHGLLGQDAVPFIAYGVMLENRNDAIPLLRALDANIALNGDATPTNVVRVGLMSASTDWHPEGATCK
jgi:hypothetical protein